MIACLRDYLIDSRYLSTRSTLNIANQLNNRGRTKTESHCYIFETCIVIRSILRDNRGRRNRSVVPVQWTRRLINIGPRSKLGQKIILLRVNIKIWILYF